MMSCLMDNCNLSPAKLNQEEREILIEWKLKGFISGAASDYSVSSEFYDAMVAILKIGYCSDMID